jgi:hypothetical protein
MDAELPLPPPPRRLIVSHARPEAFVPMSRVILARMGYAILSVEEWRETPLWADRHPEVRIVDEHRLDEVPREGEGGGEAPLVLLTGRRGATRDDPRILGAIRKPAGLHELHRLLQQALEACPRSVLRVPTHLPARCRHRGRELRGSVLSLSENGCLLRTSEPLTLGAELEIAFELPRAGLLETRAETTYQLLPDTGVVFQAPPAGLREAIHRYVEDQLAPA